MSNSSEISKQINDVAADLNESTPISWLWAFLFGPIWFAFIGNWKWAVIIFFLNFFIIGFILAPFVAYPAHREVAKKKAREIISISK